MGLGDDCTVESTKMRLHSCCICYLLFGIVLLHEESSSFMLTSPRPLKVINHVIAKTNKNRETFLATNVVLLAQKQPPTPNDIYGIDRGLPLLGFAFLLSAWFFTIPPEFRRARFCASDLCVSLRCNDCMTVNEWTTGIKDYYQNGGGIHWDFSIDPKSKL
jgi:hypothetical protein